MKNGILSNETAADEKQIKKIWKRTMKSENSDRDLISNRTRISRNLTRLVFLAIFALTVSTAGTAFALNINLTYEPDATFMNAGLSAQDIVDMKAAMTYSAAQLTSRYTDANVNININVTAVPGTDTLGMSSFFIVGVDSYAALRAAMAADSRSTNDATALGAGGSVPVDDPITVPNHIYVTSRAQGKALGLRPDDMQNDGTFTFGGGHMYTYDPNNRAVAGRFDFVGLALHELTEIMGRVPELGGMVGGMPAFMEMDLFHYTGAGTRGLNNGPGRFFSIDNGTTLLKGFNDEQANPMSDPQDWAAGTDDAFNAFSNPGVLNELSAVDLQVVDVIGYDLGQAGPTPTPGGTPTPTPGAGATTLGNISTRLFVDTGNNVLIGGFIVTGTAQKRVIIRAIGPSLTTVPDRLADPTLELHDGTGATIMMNDNWRTTQEAEIMATGIAPTNDAESAIVATLPANNAAYTAVVRGANNTTGIGLVEVYDLTSGQVDSKLGNISTRGSVQTGNNVLIAGTIVVGQDPQRVIVRALGPSLQIAGQMADPTLELRNANGTMVITNDNWRTDQEAEIMATGVAPTNDAESAIVATLPGAGSAYTAIVRGANDTTGIALVEMYQLAPAGPIIAP